MVVNFAAETHVDRSIVEPLEAVRTNTVGVATLAEAARRAGVGRFLQVGTDEEYGTISDGSFAEDDRLEPSSPYSAGKAGGSLVALAYAATHKLDVVVTRCTNNYGPYQFPEKVIPLFVTNLMDGHKVPLYGSGGNIRDWLFVLDHCSAIDLVLRRGQTGGHLQHRRRQRGHQPGADPAHPGRVRGRRGPDRVRGRPAGPRLALLAGHDQGPGARLGAGPRLRPGPGRDDRLVPVPRGLVAPDEARRGGPDPGPRQGVRGLKPSPPVQR